MRCIVVSSSNATVDTVADAPVMVRWSGQLEPASPVLSTRTAWCYAAFGTARPWARAFVRRAQLTAATAARQDRRLGSFPELADASPRAPLAFGTDRRRVAARRPGPPRRPRRPPAPYATTKVADNVYVFPPGYQSMFVRRRPRASSRPIRSATRQGAPAQYLAEIRKITPRR
jgi:hypothetical protein